MLLDEILHYENEDRLALIIGMMTALMLGQQTLVELLAEKGLISKAEFEKRLLPKVAETKATIDKCKEDES